MAIRTISDTGGFYNSTASWQEGAVPTSVDDVVSTSTSGPLTVNVFSAAKSIDLSQYANTLTMNNGITISGSFSLGTGFTISGTFGVVVNSSGSLRSYGLTWSNSLTFAGTNMTYTFIDDWVVNSIDFRGSSTTILNGKTITASNGLTQNSGAQISGTTKIILTGGTWSHIGAGRISNSVDLSGNINFGTNIYSGGGTISYITGTIVSTGNTFNLQTGTLNLVNTNSIDFNNFTVTGTSILNGSNFNLLGNLTISSGLSGTSTIIIKGTTSQTWTSTAYLSNNLTINKISGTLSLSANTYYSSGTLSYISGSVSTTGNTLNPVSCVLNTNGINWNNILFGVDAGNTAYTITLGSNLKVLNSFYLPTANALTINNSGGYLIDASTAIVQIGLNNGRWDFSPWGSITARLQFSGVFNCLDLTLRGGNGGNGIFENTTFNINRNLTFWAQAPNNAYIGSSILNMIGTGSISHPFYSIGCYLSFYINTTGTVTFTTSGIDVRYNPSYLSSFVGTTFSYLQGNVVTTGSAQSLSSCVVSTKGVTWSSISLATCNIISDFSATTLSTSGTINSLTSSITATSFTNTGTINNSTYSIVSTTINNSGTINSGGITVNNLTVSGAINGGTTSISGNLTVSGTTVGTSNFILLGTSSQTWSHTTANYISNNLILNKPSGTFSLSGNVYYQGGTLSYVSGSYSTTGSTLNLGNSCVLDSNGIIWNNVTNTTTATVSLATDLKWSGTYSITGGTIGFTGSGSLTASSTGNFLANGSSTTNFKNDIQVVNATLGPATLNRNIIYLTGNLNTTGNTTGTSSIIMMGLGTQTWSSSVNAYLNNNLKIDKPSGALNISGNIYYQSGTFSFVSGSYSTTGSTLNLGTSCRIDSNNLIWNNITNTTSAIIDLPSNMAWGGTWSVTSGSLTFSGIGSLTASISGNAAISGSSIVSLKNDIQVVNAILGIATINNSNMSITGNLTINNTTSGTTTLLINGTTSQLWTSSAYLSNNLTINKISGTLSLSSNTYYQTGTLSYISGSVSTTGNTLNIGGSTFLSTSGIQWNIFACSATSTITLNSDLYVGNSFNIGTSVARPVTFTGPGLIITTQSTNIRIGNSLWSGSGSQNPAVGNTILTFNNPQIFSISNLTLETNADARYFIPGIGYNISSGSVPYSLNINNATFYVYGTFSVGWYNEGVASGYQPNSFTSSNTTIITKGSGNIFVSGNGSYRNQIPLTIDAIGTYTFTSSALSTVTFTNTTINYLSGSVSGLPVTFDTCSLNFPLDRRWGTDVQLSGSTVISTTASFGNLTTQTSTVAITGTGSINVAGNLSINVSTTGVTKPIIINGTGSQTWTATSYLSNDLNINKTSGTLTINGNVYYQSGTLSYISGTVSTTNSTINIGGSTNLQTDGIRWFNINNAAAATVNLVNNLSFTGTWSAVAGVISYTGSGILSPTASSRINFSGTSNVTVPDSVNGITMSSITLTTSGTTQLRGTISCSGLLTLGGSGAINNASGFTGFIKTGGGLSMTGNASGTATIILNGGTWSASGANYLSNSLILDGNIRIGANIYYNTGTISYISGNIDTSTNLSTLTINATTRLDTSTFSWYNLSIDNSNPNITLLSDLNIINNLNLNFAGPTFITPATRNINCNSFLLNLSNTSWQITLNNALINTNDFTATGINNGGSFGLYGTVSVNRNLSITGNVGHQGHVFGGSFIMTGSGEIITTSAMTSTLIINTPGKVIMPTVFYSGASGPVGAGGQTITYIKGRVIAKNSTLSMQTTFQYVLRGMDKIAWKSVVINSGSNLSMNEFFSGTPETRTTILPSSTGTYSVTFTDNFEKLARYVNPTNLWVKPGQLLITTDGRRSSTNRGLRYINSLPNGVSKNLNVFPPQLGTFLLNDPAINKP